MAQHGGRLSGCNVETAQAVGGAGVISLLQPRPGMARRQNDYIETPLRPHSRCKRQRAEWPAAKDSDDSGSASDGSAAALNASGPRRPNAPARAKQALFGGGGPPVTSQPCAAGPHEEKAPPSARLPEPGIHRDSIICRQCGRCKCESCRSPKRLPAKWICNDKYLCSADNCIDYCSCLCCVKGLFYHLAKDYETDNEASCADRPCSCVPHERCPRWSCLALASLFLPCLCCYWPLRGCLKTTETCYAAYSGHGCRCSPGRTVPPIEKIPEKLLLDTNSDC
ncbi:protein sprouty homolog 2-like [Centruroides vittatus]|uniref:protein sprouty homolog 2-like n=1 Tax=Centruroides vittatus TaxID=120091 RepID=UPI00350FC573